MKIFELDIFGFTLAPTYYGLSYALTFIIGYLIFKKRNWLNQKQIDDLFFYIVAWVIVWGRLGYVLFYNLSSYMQNPLDIFKVWEWWMSFHGGTIWVIIAMILFAYKNKLNFYKLADHICIIVPIGIALIRFANYLNKELLGFSYTGLLSINGQFPSPLLESFLEWIVLFGIIYYFYRRQSFTWQIASVFLIGYWFFRVLVELFVRLPDAQVGYVVAWVSRGAILSMLMIFAWLYFYIQQKNNAKLQ